MIGELVEKLVQEKQQSEIDYGDIPEEFKGKLFISTFCLKWLIL